MKIIRFPLIVATGVTAVALGAWSLQAQTPPAPKAAAPAAKSPTPAAAEAAPGKSRESHRLTAAQRAKLDELRRTQREKLQAIRADDSLTPEQKRAKARESLAAARAELSGVFTPEQQERFQKAREHLHQRMRHAARAHTHRRIASWHEQRAGWGRPHDRGHAWGPGRHHAPRGHGFAPGFQRQRGPMGPGPGFRRPGSFGRPGQPGGSAGWGFAPGGATQFGDLGLTDDQKAKLGELQKQQREKMSESMKSFQQEFRALLTPEQQQKFDARRTPRPPGDR